MTKIARTRISKTKSGLNFYLNEEIVTQFSKTSRYGVVVKGTADEGYVVDLIGGEGRIHMCEYADPERPLRISFRDFKKVNGSLQMHEMERFGVTEIDHEILEGGVRFRIPRVSELSEPREITRRTKAQMQLKLEPPAVVTNQSLTDHEHLGFLLSELNILLASGKVDDVDLEISHPGAGDAGNDWIVYKPKVRSSAINIKGKIIREETLG